MATIPTLVGNEMESLTPFRTQVYKATHDGQLRLPFMQRSFISFSYGGKNIEDFNLIAYTSNDRIERSGYAEFEDLTSTYDTIQGQFYWGTYFHANTLSLTLATDAMTEVELDNFKRWFRAGSIRELIMAEHPNRAIMARIATPPQLHLLGFKQEVEVPFAAGDAGAGEVVTTTMYSTYTTVYRGEIDLEFVMDEPFWYSIKNVLGVQNTLEGYYEDNWIDANGKIVRIADSSDALKIVYEDHIPLGSTTRVDVFLGGNTYATVKYEPWSCIVKEITQSEYNEAISSDTITPQLESAYCKTEEAETVIDESTGRASIQYVNHYYCGAVIAFRGSSSVTQRDIIGAEMVKAGVTSSGGHRGQIPLFDEMNGNVNLYNRPRISRPDIGEDAYSTLYTMTLDSRNFNTNLAFAMNITPIPSNAYTYEDILTEDELYDYVQGLLDTHPASGNALLAADRVTNGGQGLIINLHTANEMTDKIVEDQSDRAELLHLYSSVYEDIKAGAQFDPSILDDPSGDEVWLGAKIGGTSLSNVDAAEGISLANQTPAYLYYAGTAPSPVILRFSLSPQLRLFASEGNKYYIVTPINKYSNSGTCNTITLKSTETHTFKFTLPTFWLSYNQALEIFYNETLMAVGAGWLKVREAIRDTIRHPVVRSWANMLINKYDYAGGTGVISSTDVRADLADGMSLLICDNYGEPFPASFTFDGKTGLAIGKFTYRNMNLARITDSVVNSLRSQITGPTMGMSVENYTITSEENVGDMVRSNYLILDERNVLDENYQVQAWTDTHPDYAYLITHDVANGLQDLHFEFKNMYL